MERPFHCRLNGKNLDLLQVRIGCWISENSKHCYNLAFVVKRVGYDVQQDKRGTPEFASPIGRALCKSRVQLILGKSIQVKSQ